MRDWAIPTCLGAPSSRKFQFSRPRDRSRRAVKVSGVERHLDALGMARFGRGDGRSHARTPVPEQPLLRRRPSDLVVEDGRIGRPLGPAAIIENEDHLLSC